MEYLYMRSFNELEAVFRTNFKESKAFKEMVIELNSNMIEYKFLHKAGIIKTSWKKLFNPWFMQINKVLS